MTTLLLILFNILTIYLVFLNIKLNSMLNDKSFSKELFDSVKKIKGFTVLITIILIIALLITTYLAIVTLPKYIIGLITVILMFEWFIILELNDTIKFYKTLDEAHKEINRINKKLKNNSI